ncbi:hypothetical protein [Halosimplex amylolyticum]
MNHNQRQLDESRAIAELSDQEAAAVEKRIRESSGRARDADRPTEGSR